VDAGRQLVAGSCNQTPAEQRSPVPFTCSELTPARGAAQHYTASKYEHVSLAATLVPRGGEQPAIPNHLPQRDLWRRHNMLKVPTYLTYGGL